MRFFRFRSSPWRTLGESILTEQISSLRAARTMLDTVTTTFSQYMAFYGKYFTKQWNDMGPTGYGILLISIGIFGWMLMKSGIKGPGS